MNLTLQSFRTTIMGLALGASFLLVAAPIVRADDDCQKRIIHLDHKLHEAAEHHGWDSPEAAKYRLQLADARAWCWEHSHRWWDEDEHRWHTERDWDDYDHDHHDHDHH
ncbi:MAG TPA: hypothetical protein VJX70_01505 [Candidatus Acidoferrum sp.]|nr:hypothetical protein [Candidatus Acidoferrum sp.]